jgi:hypothetical protein
MPAGKPDLSVSLGRVSGSLGRPECVGCALCRRKGSKTRPKPSPFVLHSFPAPLKAALKGLFKQRGREVLSEAHRFSGRDKRPSSSLCTHFNAALMMHGAATAADLDYCRGWLLEDASHFSSCGALAIVLFAAGARGLLM